MVTSTFRENRCPHKNFQFSTAVALKIRAKVNKIESVLCYVPIIYPYKFGKNLTTGSQDIVQTRKCDANANTDADASANSIRTKNKMFPSPQVGRISS